MKNKRGISLITLVITIIIIIILAAVVIINLGSNNVISNAEKAALLNNVDSYKSELSIYTLSKYADDQSFNSKKLYADKDTLKYNGEVLPGKTIKDVITIIKKDDLNKFIVEDGELKYIGDNKAEEDALDGIVSQSNLVIKLSIENVEYTSISLNINITGKYYLNGDVKSLEIKYKKIEETNYQSKNITFDKTVADTKYVLDNLIMNERYDIIVVATIKDGKTYEKEIKEILLSNDTTNPTIPTAIEKKENLNTIEVKASGSTDSETGIIGYMYSLDNNTFTEVVKENEYYKFENIKSGTNVTIYAKAVNGVYMESEVYSTTGSTIKPIGNVEFSLSTTELTGKEVTITLSYPNEIPVGYVIQYKVGTGNWITGASINLTSNSTVYGRLYNSTADDEIALNSIDVTNIDSNNYTITLEGINKEYYTVQKTAKLGEEVTVIITNTDNFRVFKNLTIDGTEQEIEKTNFVMPAKNITLKANFKEYIIKTGTMNKNYITGFNMWLASGYVDNITASAGYGTLNGILGFSNAYYTHDNEIVFTSTGNGFNITNYSKFFVDIGFTKGYGGYARGIGIWKSDNTWLSNCVKYYMTTDTPGRHILAFDISNASGNCRISVGLRNTTTGMTLMDVYNVWME